MEAEFRRFLPGGETRSITYYAPYPVVIRAGSGATITDIDGNEYVDVVNNYTALVHGHAFRPIIEAAVAAATSGTVHPAPTRALLDLAQAICSRYPAIERIRFTNSGTEASLLALRIARKATGRRRFLVFDGGYHGTAPEFVDPSPDRVSVPYNDLAAAESALDENIAAVFVEPFLGSGGVIPAGPGFLVGVAAAAAHAGAVLVLDEVQSLRNALGGAQGALGLRPDLTTMGKIIGGGFPVGAVGGSNELMQLTAADRPDGLKHSGTFNGNPVTAAAGLASLSHLDGRSISRLEANAEALSAAILCSAKTAGVPVAVTRAGSILHVHLLNDEHGSLGSEALVNARVATQAGAADQGSLHLALLVNGIFATPRGMLNLSTAMTKDHLDAVAVGYELAFRTIATVRSG